ncbi:unnamed protein product [Haemonchus placei]|uniref:Endo/exonuclease/phosphatase domain-containing protein n=1 Tax=Haemonchus placei TaxID=6290 RepID=A0A0N4WTC4_HAEPC|nr:unnamed protein product [Haemonchus placei]
MEKPSHNNNVNNNFRSLKEISDKARTSLGSGAQDPRPSPMEKMRGLPRSELSRSKKSVRIGSLNVGSLTGKSRGIADLRKRRNIQVLCHQETRWKGPKVREIGEGVKLFYNGVDTQRNGVAMAVADSFKNSVSTVSRISSRIMAVRIHTKDGYWAIISVYAPQVGCPVVEKDEFYLNERGFLI